MSGQRIMVMSVNLVLEREPGEYPDITVDQVTESVVEQVKGCVLFATDQLVPYRVVFAAAPNTQ